jgi:hypothetical protein
MARDPNGAQQSSRAGSGPAPALDGTPSQGAASRDEGNTSGASLPHRTIFSGPPAAWSDDEAWLARVCLGCLERDREHGSDLCTHCQLGGDVHGI